MQERELGNTGITLPSVGLGCMGLSEFYGPPTETKAAVRLLHEAIELGVVHFDTAEMYGMGSTNEQLLGTALHDRREQVFIATKFGPLRDSTTGAFIGVDGSRENCRRAIEGSLRRLRTDYVDLYYLHRVDTETPIETTVEAMAELVEAGMVRAIGLSEASAETLKRASSVHPIAALQSEYSIFSRDIESEVIPACLETGTSLVAYSPLGRGLLSGRFSESSSAPEDYRASTPRFQGDALTANAALVAEIDSIASELGAATAQIALAWVLSRGEHIVTIPGTTKLEHLQANVAAMALTLAPEQVDRLNRLADQVIGERYDARGMASVNR